jgi:hypothetical protein
MAPFFKVMGIVWIGMGLASIFVMMPQQRDVGALEWIAVTAELAAGLLFLGIGFFSRERWWPFRRKLPPDVETVFGRLEFDEGYSIDEAARDLLRLRRRHDAIRLYREAAGLTPSEAKSAVSAIEREARELSA